jgi:hypothetical protein
LIQDQASRRSIDPRIRPDSIVAHFYPQAAPRSWRKVAPLLVIAVLAAGVAAQWRGQYRPEVERDSEQFARAA